MLHSQLLLLVCQLHSLLLVRQLLLLLRLLHQQRWCRDTLALLLLRLLELRLVTQVALGPLLLVGLQLLVRLVVVMVGLLLRLDLQEPMLPLHRSAVVCSGSQVSLLPPSNPPNFHHHPVFPCPRGIPPQQQRRRWQ